MITIRPARLEDTKHIVKFNMAMALETEQKELDRDILSAGVQAVFADRSRGFYIVAEADGEAIGSLLITPEWSDWRNGPYWWIQSVYILPEWRRKGVFHSLYTFVAEKAAENDNVRGLRLYVEKNNTIARTCYEALGMNESIYTLYEQPVK